MMDVKIWSSAEPERTNQINPKSYNLLPFDLFVARCSFVQDIKRSLEVLFYLFL